MNDRSFCRSQALLSRAELVIPGGVNSPVRAFKSVGGTPLFIQRASGPYLFDEDGHRYIDYVGSWGPMILGHNSPIVLNAIHQALERGTSFGAPTDLEVEFAELLVKIIPSLEMVRAVNSGTEATMSAIRLARAFTGRDILIKFNGCYHGHSDSLLVKAGSGVATFGIAGSPGVPEVVARSTISCEFNDLERLRAIFSDVGGDRIAAIIIEPVPGNMGLVQPIPGFLEGVRKLCDDSGALLIFDEVMSGFRVGLTGAQGKYQIRPDLSTFGKVIGGGLPVGAFGGRMDIMKQLAPSGPVYQAGTLSGNPLAVSAGLAVLNHLVQTDPYPYLESLAARWCAGMRKIAEEYQISLSVEYAGSMIGAFFHSGPVQSFRDALDSDVPRFNRYFHEMLERGVYLAPSAFEAGFIGTSHTPELIDETLAAARESIGATCRQ